LKYRVNEAVALQDEKNQWHRGIITGKFILSNIVSFQKSSVVFIIKELPSNDRMAHIFHLDSGEETIQSLYSIRPLEASFCRQPAFAIPCRLHEIFPINREKWEKDDPIHDEFRRMTNRTFNCRICHAEKFTYFDVNILTPGKSLSAIRMVLHHIIMKLICQI
jgi:hypothetical protein